MASEGDGERLPSESELVLLEFLLREGGEVGSRFLPQLPLLRVSHERCPCGCASLTFRVEGMANPESGTEPVAEALFLDAGEVAGLFVNGKGGVLQGLEVEGYVGDAPRRLPQVSELRPRTDEAFAELMKPS